MGFLGVLETKSLPHVPATVHLNELGAENHHVTQGLKHGTGKNSHIVLVPQPSEDPNDPLNWSYWKKLRIVLIVSLGACLYASTFGPLLVAGAYQISQELGVTFTDVSLLAGYQLLVAGSTGALVSALSRKWGKRPVFVFSALFGLIGSIVGSVATSYSTLMGARVIQGFSTAAYESLTIALVGDLFFVHERGLYITISQFVLASVSNFSSVLTGPITSNLGWRYLFYLCVVIGGVQTLLLFLFCPETQFNRDHRYEIDESIGENLEDLAEIEKQHMVTSTGPVGAKNERSEATHMEARVIPKKKTIVQELALVTGTYSSENVVQLFIAPFACCSNLVVLWAVVQSGTITATYVAMSYVLAQIFAFPPYSLSAAGVGNLFLGPFLGGVIASLVFGWINDPLIKWCSRKNNGVYEPEYRLLLMVPALVAGIGLMAFGKLAQDGASIYVTATMHGFVIFGITAATISVCPYALDAYRDMSSEIFVAGIIYKNFLFYGFSYFVNNWTATAGPTTVFYVFGGVVFGLMATTLLVFFFGKKYRALWARNNLMEKMHIRTHAEI
ncbi:hypothetical protein LTR84_001305 [Exophiala bonariae]|uniref:Major facilitator superfamily (MFS) profile domain-containing protein n=1 Tax=Exophiala bonariae TaxID=1690606 RepID=A0AAV9NC54_9EURO|nr:hypothetical protein LTR84_001305 [Exophiala bonariae]